MGTVSDMIDEIWRDACDYEDLYEVSNFGRVRRKDNMVLMDGNTNSYGYRMVALSRDGKRKNVKIHRLVAKAFIPNPLNKRNVNHKDGDRVNNHVDNLEWVSHGENHKHAVDVLGVDYSAKPVVQLSREGDFIAIWKNATEAATIVGGKQQMIGACCKGTAPTAYNYRWEFAQGKVLELFNEWPRVRCLQELQLRRAELTAQLDEVCAEILALESE